LKRDVWGGGAEISLCRERKEVTLHPLGTKKKNLFFSGFGKNFNRAYLTIFFDFFSWLFLGGGGKKIFFPGGLGNRPALGFENSSKGGFSFDIFVKRGGTHFCQGFPLGQPPPHGGGPPPRYPWKFRDKKGERNRFPAPSFWRGFPPAVSRGGGGLFFRFFFKTGNLLEGGGGTVSLFPKGFATFKTQTRGAPNSSIPGEKKNTGKNACGFFRVFFFTTTLP